LHFKPKLQEYFDFSLRYEDIAMRSAGNLKQVGLARALSKMGYCSRSQGAELVRAGRVKLNGAIRLNPEAPVILNRDRIEVDRRPVEPGTKVYLMLNKPRGIVTTAADEKGRDTVYSYLDNNLPWVAPVGRLDKASEGLLLFTNDSEWSARISSPEMHLDKTYHVQVVTIADEKLLDRLTEGVTLDSGENLRAKRAGLLRTGIKNTWLEVVLDEGKNRHIRRMLSQLDIDVLRLVRVAIGPVVLGKLAKGACRPLAVEEKRSLDREFEIGRRHSIQD
jgi:23S rRNA pseudouridine2605 synthase